MTWRERAACRGMDPFLFFPESPGGSAGLKLAHAACHDCPVQRECLNYAVTTFSSNWDYGIWGNTNAKQRRKLRKRAA